MKFFVGANDPASLRQATEWLKGGRDLHLLDSWARTREAAWGECFVFLEIVLPAEKAAERNQIDLIVAFDSRVALCELKRHSSLQGLNIRDLDEQISSQQEVFKSLLSRGRFGDSFARLLFFPHLGVQELSFVASQLNSIHSRPDIFVTGSSGRLPQGSAEFWKLNFVNLLNEKLSNHEVTFSGKGDGRVQAYLRRVLCDGQRSLREFCSSKDTLFFLEAVIRAPHVPYPRNYVPDTRKCESQQVLALLQKSRVVEISGPPGIGKSVLVCEVIAALGSPYFQELEVPRLNSADQVARYLEFRMEGGTDRLISSSTLIERLAGAEDLFWIRAYDEQTRSALAEFLVKILSSRQEGSIWVVESTRSLAVAEISSLELGAMKRSDLARVLSQNSDLKTVSSIEASIDGSFGNPGDAIQIMRTGSPDGGGNLFGWFEIQLSRHAKRILQVVCLTIARAPLGLSRRLIEKVIIDALPDLPSQDCLHGIQEVMVALKSEQLADVTTFNASQFGGVLSGVVSEETEFEFLNSIKSGLLLAEVRQITSDRTIRWIEALDKILVDDADSGNLADVTFNILHHNLEPFFRSSFRFTSLGSVVLQWIETSDWEPPNRRQAYLLRALRVLAALNRDRTTQVEDELGLPDQTDPVQVFAFKFVLAREMTVRQLPPEFDLGIFCDEVEQLEDRDLRTAYYVSCCTALQFQNRHSEALKMLRSIAERYSAVEPSGLIIRIQLGDILNTTEGKTAVGAITASNLTQALSRELINGGLHVENIHLVSSGVFYFVRAVEIEEGRTTFASVLQYLAALDWIEQLPGVRARWRMRTLLTRGSLHRHYLRQDGLPWSEFSIHMKLAWEDYNRTWNSAFSAKHVLHSLSAASYMTGLCRFGMRYLDDESAQRPMIEYCSLAFEKCTIALHALHAVGTKEIDIMENLERALATVGYLKLFSDRALQLDGPALTSTWDRYADLVIAKRGSWNHKCIDPMEESRKEICRALLFGQSVDRRYHSQLLPFVKPAIERLLRMASSRRGFRPPPSWKRLESILKNSHD